MNTVMRPRATFFRYQWLRTNRAKACISSKPKFVFVGSEFGGTRGLETETCNQLRCKTKGEKCPPLRLFVKKAPEIGSIAREIERKGTVFFIRLKIGPSRSLLPRQRNERAMVSFRLMKIMTFSKKEELLRECNWIDIGQMPEFVNFWIS